MEREPKGATSLKSRQKGKEQDSLSSLGIIEELRVKKEVPITRVRFAGRSGCGMCG